MVTSRRNGAGFLLCVFAAAVLVAFPSCRKEEPQVPLPVEEPQEIEAFLKSIPRVLSVERLEDGFEGFESAWKMTFDQPLDHFDGRTGHHIPQRVYLHFKSYDAPVVFYGTGYQILDYIPDVSKLLNANVIEFEYRYFGESVPDGMYPDVNWTYLTSEQASADLHDIYGAFKPAFRGKWVSSGVSKGGITSAMYARFYPDDMDLYLPFCAPFCKSLNDDSIGKWVSDGVATAEVREAMVRFIKMALRMQGDLCDEALSREEFKTASRDALAVMMPVYVINTFFNRLAYTPVGKWYPEIPGGESSAAEVLDFILGKDNAGARQQERLKMDLTVALTKSGEDGAQVSANPYMPQARRELGYFSFDLAPFREEVEAGLVNEAHTRFGDSLGTPAERAAITYSDTLMVNFLGKFLPRTGAKMIFVYGQDDYWTGAGVRDNCGNPNIERFLVRDSNHTDSFLGYPHNEDTEALSAAINRVLGL